MNKYLRKIGEITLVAGLVTASYFVGLNQHPSFNELPKKAQQAVVETHQDLDTLLTQAVNQYKQGNPKKALELYRQVEQEAESLERIDPQYENIESRMFQYGAAIVDTNIIIQNLDQIDKIMEKGVVSITEYVGFGDWALNYTDERLEFIGQDSSAHVRLGQDNTIAKKALQNYYNNSSLRWDKIQEEMRDVLIRSPNKDYNVKTAIEILDKRVKQIKKRKEKTKD